MSSQISKSWEEITCDLEPMDISSQISKIWGWVSSPISFERVPSIPKTLFLGQGIA